ncbi:MAG TPA: ASKHA domain-containing protein [Chlorobaculum sp.]|nr:ASKHA domain-containing protein [Chlorobaculum sp.]
MPRVFFHGHQKELEVPAGTSVLDAARRAGISMESPCNREGTCGKCRVIVHGVDGEAVRNGQGGHILSAADQAAGFVLGCQAYIHGDVRVELPGTTNSGLSIITEGKCRDFELNPWIQKKIDPIHNLTYVTAGGQLLETEYGDTTATLYGAAIDLGTTTLVVSLVDLKTGNETASVSTLNPQALHAQDVLSRIKISSTEEGMAVLQGELIRELDRMIGELSESEKIDRTSIYEVILSGNTTMLTIAAGRSPSSLGKYPYGVEFETGRSYPAVDIGLHVAEKGSVWFPPVASAYVGADIISGVVAADLSRLKGLSLFVDIGTNGEMVLSRDGKMTATSTAAGPAFEGMNISSGMRAASGAIERVLLVNGRVDIQVISGTTPVGLCGSGLLDAVAELARAGIADGNGRLAKPGSEVFEKWRHHLEVVEGRTRFRLAEKVTLSQQDIRQVQLAKAAIRAGMDMLLKSCSVSPEEIDRVFIAGSFGKHLKVSSLVTLGLIPESVAERVEFLGNTSSSGAVAFLLDRRLRDEAASIVDGMVVLELSREPVFEQIFIKALAFPQAAEQQKERVDDI